MLTIATKRINIKLAGVGLYILLTIAQPLIMLTLTVGYAVLKLTRED